MFCTQKSNTILPVREIQERENNKVTKNIIFHEKNSKRYIELRKKATLHIYKNDICGYKTLFKGRTPSNVN